MALIHCDFHSDVLGMATQMCVILPERPLSKARRALTAKHPTLYLLHGLSDDHTIWQRRTSIERYAADLDLAVVMPNVHRSFYADMAHGRRYWTFVSEELPARARYLFPLSAERKDNFVAGLSMGGYGAFKMALRCPAKFAAAASLSGALDMARNAGTKDPAWRRELRDVFGPLDKIAGSNNDLLWLAGKVARSRGPKPALYQWCGAEDFLYQDNLTFRDHARSVGLAVTYEEGPGSHEWQYWDTQIQRVLAWLPVH